jgi:hypothetical protein
MNEIFDEMNGLIFFIQAAAQQLQGVQKHESRHQLQTFELSGKTGSSFYTCKHCYSENGLRALAYAVRLINST